jgi:hypothetical protein
VEDTEHLLLTLAETVEVEAQTGGTTAVQALVRLVKVLAQQQEQTLLMVQEEAEALGQQAQLEQVL